MSRLCYLHDTAQKAFYKVSLELGIQKSLDLQKSRLFIPVCNFAFPVWCQQSGLGQLIQSGGSEGLCELSYSLCVVYTAVGRWHLMPSLIQRVNAPNCPKQVMRVGVDVMGQANPRLSPGRQSARSFVQAENCFLSTVQHWPEVILKQGKKKSLQF